jgi:hypothetical protein
MANAYNKQSEVEARVIVSKANALNGQMAASGFSHERAICL